MDWQERNWKERNSREKKIPGLPKMKSNDRLPWQKDRSKTDIGVVLIQATQ